jgi:FdhD protein
MPAGFERVEIVRFQDDQQRADSDLVAAERPLEVRLNGEAFSVIMRTPGADRELAAGFLFSESVIGQATDVGAIDCQDDIVNVTLVGLAAARLPELLASRRQVVTNSSCGLCGRRTLDSLGVEIEPLTSRWATDRGAVVAMPEALRRAQAVFAETGGLHAAGLFTRTGELELLAEDVGRHNAVDKVVGQMLLAWRLPLTEAMLCVSGRSSFEIVQKALLAGIPLIAAVSAPSSLAIRLADEAGITLLGFVRGGRFNIYTHPSRIDGHTGPS